MKFLSKPILVLIIIFLSIPLVLAQESTKTEIEESSDPAPEAIDFPEWAEDLRRGEIIFFGSLPFTMLLTNLGYQGIDYLIETSAGNKVTFGTMTRTDQINVLYITMGISLSIAITDYILGCFEDE